MNFIASPIIIKGVNHSGTRALVKILELLGSDPGIINNKWYENIFYLELHKTLISKISKKTWTETIFNADFLNNGYNDQLEYLDFINEKLNELDKYYFNPKKHIWHWKCPSSALFENTWNEIYPNAYNIIIKREPNNVARSLLRNGLITNYDDAIKFYNTMNKKIFSITKKNVITVQYDNLRNEIDKIADFIPLNIDDQQIKLAKAIVKKESLIRLNKSVLYNIKNVYTESKIRLYNLNKKMKSKL